MSAPVKHTCPDIDKLIREVRILLRVARRAQSGEDINLADEIDYYLSDFESKLEELRDSNSKLRDWGEKLEEILRENEIYY
jgi:thiamine kinase-like enzyme